MENDDGSPLLHDSFDVNRSIVFAALVSVSTVILLAIIYNLYLRCLCRRQGYRPRRVPVGNPSQLSLTTYGNSPPDPMVIDSLPMFRFKQAAQQLGNYHDKSTECSVCLTMLKDEEMVRVLPNCKHVFHAECIDKWLSLHSTCPLCRVEVEPRVKPEPREGPSMAIVEYSSPPPLADHEGRIHDVERQ